MSNEPKKPMLQYYPGGWDGITQYVVDTNAYVNRLESEVERLQSDLARCKADTVYLTSELKLMSQFRASQPTEDKTNQNEA